MRTQSPSSINIYLQCPRRYYYQYILKLPTLPSIHLIRGSVVHKVLECFFTDSFSEDDIQVKLLLSLKKLWSKENFTTINLTKEETEWYYNESQMMLINWSSQFINKLNNLVEKGLTKSEAFKVLTPIVEEHYKSESLNLQGYIDAIENDNGKIRLMDYKTSKRFHINKAYQLQLGIYALLYQEKHNKMPDEVGVYFLKDTEKVLSVTESLINNAKDTVKKIHEATDSKEICDYSKQKSPLCKWATGQCDFYNTCSKK